MQTPGACSSREFLTAVANAASQIDSPWVMADPRCAARCNRKSAGMISSTSSISFEHRLFQSEFDIRRWVNLRCLHKLGSGGFKGSEVAGKQFDSLNCTMSVQRQSILIWMPFYRLHYFRWIR